MVWTDGYGERLQKTTGTDRLIVLMRAGGRGQFDLVYVDLVAKRLTVVLVGAYFTKQADVQVATVHAGIR